MQIIGLTTVVLFLASLAAFLTGFMNYNYMWSANVLGLILFIAAAIMLGVTIRNRNKTERI